MNIYTQYLSLLQMFFHRQDNRLNRQEKLAKEKLAKEEDLLQRAA